MSDIMNSLSGNNEYEFLDIFKELKVNVYPRKEIEEIQSHPEIYEEKLLAFLSECTKGNPNDQDDRILVSMFVLGKYRSKRACRLLLDVLKWGLPEPENTNFMGDVVTECMPALLAACYDGNLEAFRELLIAPGYTFVRIAVVNALIALWAAGEMDKEAVEDFLEEAVLHLFSLGVEKDNEHLEVIKWIVLELSGVSLAKSYKIIKDHPFIARKKVDRWDFVALDVELYALCEEYERDGESSDENHYKRDSLHEILDKGIFAVESWCGAREEEEKVQIQAQTSRKSNIILDHMNHQFRSNSQKPSKKIGRNEPCICGSGKKYKKCCISD